MDASVTAIYYKHKTFSNSTHPFLIRHLKDRKPKIRIRVFLFYRNPESEIKISPNTVPPLKTCTEDSPFVHLRQITIQ